MASGYKYDVFISYNRDDEEWANGLATAFKKRGINVFIDYWSIEGGEVLTKAVIDGLKQSRYIICVITPNWINSDWCSLESQIMLLFDINGKNRRIKPILLKDCDIPEDLARLKYFDFRDKKSYKNNLNKLIKEIKVVHQDRLSNEFIKRQRQSLLNLPILPWSLEGSPSFDFLWPNLIIEPHIKVHKHFKKFTNLHEWIKEYDWKSNLAIIGSPGVGKSTTLRSMFLEFSSKEGDEAFYIILNTSDILDYILNYDNFIGYCSEKLKLKLSKRFLKNKKRLILFIDGLDEVSEDKAIQVVNTLSDLASEFENMTLWVASRKEFFFRNIAKEEKWNTFFYEILEIVEWDEEKDSLLFVKNYGNRVNNPKIYSDMTRLKDEYPEIIPLLRNPFELTLLLYLLSDESFSRFQDIKNPYTLYKSFYENWLIRERHRGTTSLSLDVVSKIHFALAYSLYSSKGEGNDLLDIAQKIDKNITLDILCKDTSFIGLLRIRNDIRSSRIIVERFIHETIGEFILGEELINTFKEGGEGLLNILSLIYNYEVNLFVRGAFQSISKGERIRVLHNFEELYTDLCSSDKELKAEIISYFREPLREIDTKKIEINDLEMETRVREQILYYIGRIPLSSFPKIIRFAYYYEPRSLLRRISALGAMLHGDEEIEKDYLSKLRPGTPQDIENRSIQLIYFGDTYGDMHTYRDDNNTSWTKTRNAIYRRMKLSSERELRLRWWDLRTLALFYESRKWKDIISIEELNLIKKCITNSDEFSEKKIQAINHEKKQLLQKMGKIAGDSN